MPAAINPDLLAGMLLDAWRLRANRNDAFLLEDAVRDNLERVVKFALGRRQEFDDPHLRSATVVEDLKHAATHALQHTLFRDDASYYQILGLVSSASAEAIRENYRLLMQVVHPDRQGSTATLPPGIAARVNRAYATLREADLRAAYDSEQRSPSAAGSAAAPSPRPFNVPRPPMQRRPNLRPILPEWLTARVGGFVRENPSVTIFSALGILALAFIVAIAISEHEAALLRDDNGSVSSIVPRPSSGQGVAHRIVDTDHSKPGPSERGVVAVSRTPVVNRQPVARPDPRPNGQTPDNPQPVAPGPPPESTAMPVASSRVSAPSVVALSPTSSAFASVTTTPPKVDVEPLPALPRPATNASQQQLAPSASLVPPPPLPVAPPAPLAAAPTSAVAVASPRSASVTLADAAIESRREANPVSGYAVDVEGLVNAFVSHYEAGRLDPFISLFDVNAATARLKGQRAIRAEYEELFRKSSERTLKISHLVWRQNGDVTEARGEVAVHIAWNDGRRVDQNLALEMDLARRDGKPVITRLWHKVR